MTSSPAATPPSLTELKERIRTAQGKAALAVNRALVLLYWQVGRDISVKQKEQGWGGGIIKRLAKDLASTFPGVQGFSARNLWRMRAFAQAYPENLPQPVAEIPWSHNVILLEKLKATDQRLWYARASIQHGWSRNVLTLQIESRLLERYGQAQTNFRVPHPLSLRNVHANGTWETMAPEEFRQSARITPAANVYSAGTLLYRLLAGRYPLAYKDYLERWETYPPETQKAFQLDLHLHEPVRYPDSLKPRVVACLERALSKRAEERYQSAREFRADLELVVHNRAYIPKLRPS